MEPSIQPHCTQWVVHPCELGPCLPHLELACSDDSLALPTTCPMAVVLDVHLPWPCPPLPYRCCCCWSCWHWCAGTLSLLLLPWCWHVMIFLQVLIIFSTWYWPLLLLLILCRLPVLHQQVLIIISTWYWPLLSSLLVLLHAVMLMLLLLLHTTTDFPPNTTTHTIIPLGSNRVPPPYSATPSPAPACTPSGPLGPLCGKSLMYSALRLTTTICTRPWVPCFPHPHSPPAVSAQNFALTACCPHAHCMALTASRNLDRFACLHSPLCLLLSESSPPPPPPPPPCQTLPGVRFALHLWHVVLLA